MSSKLKLRGVRTNPIERRKTEGFRLEFWQPLLVKATGPKKQHHSDGQQLIYEKRLIKFAALDENEEISRVVEEILSEGGVVWRGLNYRLVAHDCRRERL